MRQENETAVYWFAALQMWNELEKGHRLFERTGDMVFALERRKIGNKQKQCPVIRYKE